jgi:hypothetical protein
MIKHIAMFQQIFMLSPLHRLMLHRGQESTDVTVRSRHELAGDRRVRTLHQPGRPNAGDEGLSGYVCQRALYAYDGHSYAASIRSD